MRPTTEIGATEFLANLRPDMIVSIALILTILRLILLWYARTAQAGQAQIRPLARSAAELIESMIIAGVLVFLIIRPFFVQAFFIPSESMENTLLGHDAYNPQTGVRHNDTVHDHLFVNKLVYRCSDPKRNDIIVFKAPRSADAEHDAAHKAENILIKRCIGIPGDTIEIKNAAVYRNGVRLEEFQNPKLEYSIRELMQPQKELDSIYGTSSITGPITLKPGQYWVMGDNRNHSNDSRYWGVLDRWRIIGKASVIFWPLSRMRVLH